VVSRPGLAPDSRHESAPLGVCQCCAMGIPGIAVQPIGKGNSESAVRFLANCPDLKSAHQQTGNKHRSAV
jgi:hypothetical protein